jgi:hypothetical protein
MDFGQVKVIEIFCPRSVDIPSLLGCSKTPMSFFLYFASPSTTYQPSHYRVIPMVRHFLQVWNKDDFFLCGLWAVLQVLSGDLKYGPCSSFKEKETLPSSSYFPSLNNLHLVHSSLYPWLHRDSSHFALSALQFLRLSNARWVIPSLTGAIS